MHRQSELACGQDTGRLPKLPGDDEIACEGPPQFKHAENMNEDVFNASMGCCSSGRKQGVRAAR